VNIALWSNSAANALSDADPQKEGKPPVLTKPLAPAASLSANLVNSFIQEATEIIRHAHPANTVLLRGFAKHPSLPTIEELYKLKPVAIAHYPMYKGLAKLVGMDLAHPEEGIPALVSPLCFQRLLKYTKISISFTSMSKKLIQLEKMVIIKPKKQSLKK